ncbi:MAG: hypothetical protein IKZ71_04980, partial [Bacteroidales bacterium]|nr:hypothetical protein [Bacteroidales bacterium]
CLILRFYGCFTFTVRILPEVIDLAVGVGNQVGVFLEAEVILQDGGDQEGQLGVSGVGGIFEIVLAIAVGYSGVNRWFKVDDIAISYIYKIAELYGLEVMVKVLVFGSNLA